MILTTASSFAKPFAIELHGEPLVLRRWQMNIQIANNSHRKCILSLFARREGGGNENVFDVWLKRHLGPNLSRLLEADLHHEVLFSAVELSLSGAVSLEEIEADVVCILRVTERVNV